MIIGLRKDVCCLQVATGEIINGELVRVRRFCNLSVINVFDEGAVTSNLMMEKIDVLESVA